MKLKLFIVIRTGEPKAKKTILFSSYKRKPAADSEDLGCEWPALFRPAGSDNCSSRYLSNSRNETNYFLNFTPSLTPEFHLHFNERNFSFHTKRILSCSTVELGHIVSQTKVFFSWFCAIFMQFQFYFLGFQINFAQNHFKFTAKYTSFWFLRACSKLVFFYSIFFRFLNYFAENNFNVTGKYISF